jgi:hypothetical protein
MDFMTDIERSNSLTDLAHRIRGDAQAAAEIDRRAAAPVTRVNKMTAEERAAYMRQYRQRPGVRDRELRNKREYDLFHRDQNHARWKRRNQERKDQKADWYQRNVERIAQDRQTRRDYIAKFGRVPKSYIFTIAQMADALRTGNDPFADLRASWKRGAKDRAKRAAATRKQRKADNATWDAYVERFGDFDWINTSIIRLMRKSLKDGTDHLTKQRAEAAAHHEQWESERAANVAKVQEAIRHSAERQAKAEGPFSAKTERAYTKLIKTRKLFEGACELRWPEYFEYRDANKLKPLTANDRRYAAQYSSCALPRR